MPKPRRYTAEHASAGLDHDFPEIETWPNQFPAYEIVVDDPEFTSVCPKTGLPDFGNIVIRYVPDRRCLELKSLKEYLQAYRNLGIFQENIVNQVLEDVVRWAKPVWAEVKGEFRPRGGISTVVIARWPRGKRSQVMSRSARGGCRSWFDEFYLARVFGFDAADLVGCLQVKPKLFGRPKEAGQADSGVGTDATPFQNNVIDARRGHAQPLC